MPAAETETSFLTHAHYIDAFSRLAGLNSYNLWDEALAELPARVDEFMGSTAPAVTRASVDVDQVRRSLRAAWGTEMLLLQQLKLVEQANDLAPVAVTWAVVQTYYTGYHATQALIVAEGRARPAHHPQTQKGWVTCWAGRSGQLAPWTMMFGADGHGKLPRPVDEQVSNLSRPNEDTALDLAAKALRTTWTQTFEARTRDAAENKWKAHKKEFDAKQAEKAAAGRTALKQPDWYGRRRRNLTGAERADVAASVSPAGLLHYLFRTRIKANYLDGDVFAEGPSSLEDSVMFMTDMAFLASAIATCHEHRVRHLVGLNAVAEMKQDWCDGPGAAFPTSGPCASYRR